MYLRDRAGFGFADLLEHQDKKEDRLTLQDFTSQCGDEVRQGPGITSRRGAKTPGLFSGTELVG